MIANMGMFVLSRMLRATERGDPPHRVVVRLEVQLDGKAAE
jgi:hypothetical protein